MFLPTFVIGEYEISKFMEDSYGVATKFWLVVGFIGAQTHLPPKFSFPRISVTLF